MSSKITMDHVKKVYNHTNVVIPDLSAEVHNGEFFTLLGPSGCGKTTLLRMIAGFNSIEAGTISFDGRVMNDIAIHKRNIGMVFQNYAIFPHMTVRENIEYGLKLRVKSKEERRKKCDEIMESVKISEYADRRPDQLSGGQQQRVALARAIVIHPDVLLMDEPLSNLDAKLRIEMRSVIKDIQHKVGITTIYVTHDQEEALAVSDRIAVMDHGVIQQIGRPESIYLRPYNVTVASFIGRSNLFDVSLDTAGGKNVVSVSPEYSFEIDTLDGGAGAQPCVLSVRPEEFHITREGAGLAATVLSGTFLGKYMDYVMELPDGRTVEASHDSGKAEEFFAPGESVRLSVVRGKVNLFTADGARSLVKEVVQYA